MFRRSSWPVRCRLRKWSPSEGSVFREFVGRVDGRGGFAVVETEDVRLIRVTWRSSTPTSIWVSIPVLDVQENARIAAEAVEFRGGVG